MTTVLDLVGAAAVVIGVAMLVSIAASLVVGGVLLLVASWRLAS
ncbi:MAG: hypothetical protein M0Z51_03360 [Propionibacterium sp.]|nr:hypothetical protein [Propionibacterium sp.]